jgi:hypothetical protein
MLRKNPVQRRPQLQGGGSLKTSAQFFLILVEPDEFRMVLYPRELLSKLIQLLPRGRRRCVAFLNLYESKPPTNIRIYFAFIITRFAVPN